MSSLNFLEMNFKAEKRTVNSNKEKVNQYPSLYISLPNTVIESWLFIHILIVMNIDAGTHNKKAFFLQNDQYLHWGIFTKNPLTIKNNGI